MLFSVLHLHRQDGLLGWEARGFRERYGGDGRRRKDGGSGKLPSGDYISTRRDRRLRRTRIDLLAERGPLIALSSPFRILGRGEAPFFLREGGGGGGRQTLVAREIFGDDLTTVVP